jgi:hypothetical protein
MRLQLGGRGKPLCDLKISVPLRQVQRASLWRTIVEPDLAHAEIPMPRFFISYSHKDEDNARHMKHDLENMGAIVWLDKNEILPGDNFVAKIQYALANCEYCVIIISQNSLVSKWVSLEIEMALSATQYTHAKLIPVMRLMPLFPVARLVVAQRANMG